MLNKTTVERLILYNRVIKELDAGGKKWVTSTDIAEVLSRTPAQVRRDISSLGSKGKRGVGYNIKNLIEDLDNVLGLKERHRVAVIGAGNLSRALIGYSGFRREGFVCSLIIDNDPEKIGSKISGILVESAAQLENKIVRNNVDIAVITVPADAAQEVVERLVSGGIKEILNFAPVTINVPEDVNLRYVDLALEMENLAYSLNYRKKNMIYKAEKENIRDFINSWAERYSVYVPSETGELLPYEKGQDINWQKVPVWGGIKEFVFPGRNRVVGDEDKKGGEKPVMLVGVRGCDLRALVEVFDKIFLEQDPVDTIYKRMRDNLTLVSVDCRKPVETCFCVSVGGNPYGEKGYDLNISFLNNEVILETGSGKGEKLFDNISLQEAGSKEIKKREDIRDTSVRKIKLNFKRDYKEDNFREKIENNREKKYWQKKAEDCMICGGCNFACPTCYCNLLDEVSDKLDEASDRLDEVSNKTGIKKVLQWDACQFKGYARVGGGANPRPELWERFRHRYLCKFRIMDEEFSVPGCTGCGRCITVCPADIDIRETIEGLL